MQQPQGEDLDAVRDALLAAVADAASIEAPDAVRIGELGKGGSLARPNNS